MCCARLVKFFFHVETVQIDTMKPDELRCRLLLASGGPTCLLFSQTRCQRQISDIRIAMITAADA